MNMDSRIKQTYRVMLSRGSASLEYVREVLQYTYNERNDFNKLPLRLSHIKGKDITSMKIYVPKSGDGYG